MKNRPGTGQSKGHQMSKPPERPANHDPDDPMDVRDSSSFKAYKAAVKRLLSDKPLTTRAIHLKLGYEHQHWTLDCLELVADKHVGYIDKFTLAVRIEAKNAREWNGKGKSFGSL
jgi:hypothetical protein